MWDEDMNPGGVNVESSIVAIPSSFDWLAWQKQVIREEMEELANGKG